MRERTLQDAVTRQARSLGWLAYHTYDSRRSAPGFPDLCMVHPARGLLFAELKTERGRLRPEQQAWLSLIARAGIPAYVWRPRDWFDGTIDRVLIGET